MNGRFSDKINMIRAAAANDPIYQQLKKQIATGRPTKPDNVASELRPYVTFADELAEFGGFVFKGKHVVIPTEREITFSLVLMPATKVSTPVFVAPGKLYYFPGITKPMKEMINLCSTCARLQTETKRSR